VKFYQLLDSIPWVRDNLPRKMGFVLFLGSQVTLLIYLGVMWAIDARLDAGVVLTVASFNLGAWVACYLAMRLFLKPVEATAEVLRAYLERRPVAVLPQNGHDLLGQLMRDADYIGKRVELDASQLSRAVDDDLLTGLYSRGAGKRRLMEDVARSERGKMTFHFAFVSLHSLADIGVRHGNAKVDAVLQHLAHLLTINTRKADWVARWSEHLFAIGFCDNTQISETMRRLHNVLEQSPLEVSPGEKHAPVVCCGAVLHRPGIRVQAFYEMTRDALRAAEAQLQASGAGKRVVVISPEPVIDPELKALMK
jgi:diguanylate cyclase (GGDEF)-like protein